MAFITGTADFQERYANAMGEVTEEDDADLEELAALRLSIFRLAKEHGVKHPLLDTDESELHRLVRTQQRGWNGLLLKLERALLAK